MLVFMFVKQKGKQSQSKKKILSMRNSVNVSLFLKDYNDVFSTFDAREYKDAALSDDFLQECKKIVGESKFPVRQLKISLPSNKRNRKNEIIIQKRLHSFFLAQAHIWEQEGQREKRIAQLMIIIGILIGFFVSYIIYVGHLHPFLITLLSVIWEPASWFLIRTGADRAVDILKKTKHGENYYHKLARAKISFYDE